MNRDTSILLHLTRTEPLQVCECVLEGRFLLIVQAFEEIELSLDGLRFIDSPPGTDNLSAVQDHSIVSQLWWLFHFVAELEQRHRSELEAKDLEMRTTIAATKAAMVEEVRTAVQNDRAERDERLADPPHQGPDPVAPRPTGCSLRSRRRLLEVYCAAHHEPLFGVGWLRTDS